MWQCDNTHNGVEVYSYGVYVDAEKCVVGDDNGIGKLTLKCESQHHQIIILTKGSHTRSY